jgi:hypothetical protein
MNIHKLSKLDGVLGIRGIDHVTDDVICEECPAAEPSTVAALHLGSQAVDQLGDCRLLYGGRNGVTVIGQRFVGQQTTLIVVIRTAHPIAKSIRRLMRSAVGQKRQADASKAKAAAS